MNSIKFSVMGIKAIDVITYKINILMIVNQKSTKFYLNKRQRFFSNLNLLTIIAIQCMI